MLLPPDHSALEIVEPAIPIRGVSSSSMNELSNLLTVLHLKSLRSRLSMPTPAVRYIFSNTSPRFSCAAAWMGTASLSTVALWTFLPPQAPYPCSWPAPHEPPWLSPFLHHGHPHGCPPHTHFLNTSPWCVMSYASSTPPLYSKNQR